MLGRPCSGSGPRDRRACAQRRRARWSSHAKLRVVDLVVKLHRVLPHAPRQASGTARRSPISASRSAASRLPVRLRVASRGTSRGGRRRAGPRSRLIMSKSCCRLRLLALGGLVRDAPDGENEPVGADAVAKRLEELGARVLVGLVQARARSGPIACSLAILPRPTAASRATSTSLSWTSLTSASVHFASPVRDSTVATSCRTLSLGSPARRRELVERHHAPRARPGSNAGLWSSVCDLGRGAPGGTRRSRRRTPRSPRACASAQQICGLSLLSASPSAFTSGAFAAPVAGQPVLEERLRRGAADAVVVRRRGPSMIEGAPRGPSPTRARRTLPAAERRVVRAWPTRATWGSARPWAGAGWSSAPWSIWSTVILVASFLTPDDEQPHRAGDEHQPDHDGDRLERAAPEVSVCCVIGVIDHGVPRARARPYPHIGAASIGDGYVREAA